MRAFSRRIWRARKVGGRVALGIAMGLGLGGCLQNFPDATVGSTDIRGAIARGDIKSPRPAALALASIDGAPEPVLAQFRQAVTAEAAGRDITITDASLARYFVRGYLDAYPTDKGTAIRYVWDVYDSSKQRTQRLDDGLDIPGNPADPWSAVDDKVLSGIASRSADDIAAYLATTPEAAGTPAATVAQSGSVN